MKTIRWLLLALLFLGTFAGKHYLRYFLTTFSGSREFIGYSTFDDIQFAYCDSSGRVESQHEWTRKLYQDNPQHLQVFAEDCERFKNLLNGYVESLNQQMNQTKGVHIFQRIDGCVWDDETEKTVGFNQFGYDGEDFISLDLETLIWEAAQPQALITKNKLDRRTVVSELCHFFYHHTCPERLKTYMEYLNRFKIKPAAPSVSLLQRTPSSPVSCHSTGFYPADAVLFWRRDGQQVHEGVQYWDILPNDDDTFQMTVKLNTSLIKAEDWRRYECVFQRPGVEDIVTRLDRASIITNWVPPAEFQLGTDVAVVIAVLALVALCALGCYHRKRRNTVSDPSGNQTSSEAIALK